LASIQESVTAADAFVARFLWEPIDDDQNPQWSDILKGQEIDSITPFGGASFAEAAYAGGFNYSWAPYTQQWSDIDNSQTPSWTGVNIPQTIDGIGTYGDMFFGDVSIAGQFNRSWIPDTEQWTAIDDDQTPTWTPIEAV
jgi:hypothetical protein